MTFAVIEPALAVIALVKWKFAIDSPPSPSPSHHCPLGHPLGHVFKGQI